MCAVVVVATVATLLLYAQLLVTVYASLVCYVMYRCTDVQMYSDGGAASFFLIFLQLPTFLFLLLVKFIYTIQPAPKSIKYSHFKALICIYKSDTSRTWIATFLCILCGICDYMVITSTIRLQQTYLDKQNILHIRLP